METKRTIPALQLLALFSISFSIKMLLMPAYFSTDFDVHQNWLRITRTQQLDQWYFDSESKWTLDYPPFFAFFEWLLTQISTLIDPSISETINHNINTIYFQRISVILSQIPFLMVLFYVIGQINWKLVIAYFSLPFIILDNIHFQYNIMMQAIFILSVYFISKQHFLRGAFTYSCLLNFKHIYLYAGLAFLSYILKYYVFKPILFKQKIINLTKVAIVTAIPFLLAFLPFFVVGGFDQIKQIFYRLFPFQRGLIHQYWAPNIWALYHFLDKIMNIILNKFIPSSSITLSTVTTDLHQLRFLPQITPLMTTLLILLFSVPIIYKFWKTKIQFYKLVFICGMIFFLFGYHVHEKAITPYISLLLIFCCDKQQKNNLLFLNSAIFVNVFNLLPLLIDHNQKLLRIVLLLLWVAIWDYRRQIINSFQITICSLGIALVFYHQILHPFISSQKLQFLPLMLNSVFSATFNICWLALIYYREYKSTNELDQDDLSGYERVRMGDE